MRIVPQTILGLKWSFLPPSQGQKQILTVGYDYRTDSDVMDRCCNGKCRIICPSEVFVWILLTVFFPCALCVLCVGSITFIIYRAVKPSYAESMKKNQDVSVAIPEATPPYSSYVAMSEPTKA